MTINKPKQFEINLSSGTVAFDGDSEWRFPLTAKQTYAWLREYFSSRVNGFPPLPEGKLYDTPAGPELRWTRKQMEEYALAATSHIAPDTAAVQAEGDAMELLTSAARAWNNENDVELDATMERVEIFLIQSRSSAASPAIAPEASELPPIKTWQERLIGEDPKAGSFSDAAKSLVGTRHMKAEIADLRAAISMHRAAAATDKLPKWIDSMKGSDPTMDSVIEYIERLLAAAEPVSTPTTPVVAEGPIPTEQQILDAAEQAGLWPNTVHSWIPAFMRYHAILAAHPVAGSPAEVGLSEDPRITAIYKLRDVAERNMDAESASIISAAIADLRTAAPVPASEAASVPIPVWELYSDGWDTVDDIDGDWLMTLPIGTKLFYLAAPAAPTDSK